MDNSSSAVLRVAPEWTTNLWLNSPAPISLADLRGRVVVAAAFQMLCPGCVERTIPQLRQVHSLFAAKDVAVIGLHTVFEHHAGMGAASLRAFLHEYQVEFPVGVDQHERGATVPTTMRDYRLQGTPTLILIDQDGYLRRQTFGHIPDLQLGAEVMALVAERKSPIGDARAALGERGDAETAEC